MEYPQMRDFSEFCEQLNEMRLRFYKWDSCERTVALYYLMVGLPFANARFLQHALEQSIAAVNTPEAQMMERNANDPIFISNLLSERPQLVLSILLSHLPLLSPNNREAAESYLVTIQRVLSEFVVQPYKIYNECVEIMSYVFVHPAFNKEEKKSFKQVLKQVMDRVYPNNFSQPVNESSDESVSPNPEPVNFFTSVVDNRRLNRRSNSLTPVQTSSHENLSQVPENNWSSQENLSLPVSKPRSYSLSNDKTTSVSMNPPNTMTSSSSETRLQDLQANGNNFPLMKGIICWLKSLRLHKYSWVFNNLTYQQMMDLTEHDLENLGITKGARHKLLISIGKLKERSQNLTELEAEIMNGGDLIVALKKLKGILQTPLQASFGEDLPTQFVKVMGKVCTQILMLRQPTEECLLLFSSLCERAEMSDAFTGEQKRRLVLWRGQVARGTQVVAQTHPQQSTHCSQHNKYHGVHTQYHPITGSTFLQSYSNQKSSSYPNVQNNPNIAAHRHSLGSVTLQNQLYILNGQFPITHGQTITHTDKCSTKPYHAFNNNNNSNAGKDMHVHFKDSSDSEEFERTSAPSVVVKKTDIESSLESLCLQMMEHALGP
ncbi:protein Smaug [Agrilus planipennis]|uniref:Protein Smaug n=1 Tax=Agrilus planipennis TaxID=224129 RepID=A0A7F5RMJ2_AGRPL|nr:protein Smaug [Agrilus planipennis]